MTRPLLAVLALLLLAACGTPDHRTVVTTESTTTTVDDTAGEASRVHLAALVTWAHATATTATTTQPRRELRVAQQATPPPAFHGDIPDLIRHVFARFGPHVAEQAVRVAACETGGTFNPHALGAQLELGIFQVHPRYHRERVARLGYAWDDLRDPHVNALVAVDIYSQSGWRPWTCRP